MNIILKNKFLLLLIVLITLNSCSSNKDILYFNDLKTSEQDKIVYNAGKTQVNDILSILISSSSPDLALVYNLNQNSPIFTGYLVTSEGTITMPIIGKVKVLDLTLLEIETLISKKLVDEKQLLNPIVTVRLTNAKFTVLGEVNNPGTYTFNEQNINILQALGYAGDLTINGKRQGVLIIREENNVKTYMTIDMTSKKWFNSPYYYIKPNDVIYVNPNGPKVKSAGYIGNLGTFLTVFSTALSTVLTIIILSK